MSHIHMVKIDELKELAGQDLGYVREIIEEYILHGDKRCQLLLEAAEKRDFGKIKEVAHSFKSPSGYLGAQNLAMLLQKLERMAANEIEEEFPETLKAVQKEYEAARAELQKISAETL